jgi:drug/metabolite transporter superfamily protein YnfA
MIALMAVSGRGAFAMWGYPLWLYLGLWIVMAAPATLDAERLTRIGAAWGAVFVVFALRFHRQLFAVLPYFDHRYRAVFFPGDSWARP